MDWLYCDHEARTQSEDLLHSPPGSGAGGESKGLNPANVNAGGPKELNPVNVSAGGKSGTAHPPVPEKKRHTGKKDSTGCRNQ